MDKISNYKNYGGTFHSTRDSETRYAAEKILKIVYDHFGKLDNVIDIGCGVGTYLYVARQLGASHIQGVDGEWVDKNLLVISQEDFEVVDLGVAVKKNSINGKYDLAISMEVAEHLPKESAKEFVDMLCKLSPIVLFSAAVPGQGGVGHMNEEWQSYWAKLFYENNYMPVDLIRPRLWSNSSVYFWYRQNSMVYVRKDSDAYKSRVDLFGSEIILDVIHPDLYLNKTSHSDSYIAKVIRKLKSFVS